MQPMFMRFLLLIAIAFAASTASKAHADALNEGDARQVQAVILAQLAAFEDDDADSAFDTATPAVRDAVGSSGRFLAMVRGAYPMVYRPASVTFLKPEVDGDEVMQMVAITDGDAKSWLALFSVERQPDATWRIGACLVAENHWTAI